MFMKIYERNVRKKNVHKEREHSWSQILKEYSIVNKNKLLKINDFRFVIIFYKKNTFMEYNQVVKERYSTYILVKIDEHQKTPKQFNFNFNFI